MAAYIDGLKLALEVPIPPTDPFIGRQGNFSVENELYEFSSCEFP